MSMKQTAVKSIAPFGTLLGLAILIVSFQNCSGLKTPAIDQNKGSAYEVSTEINVVNVRPVAKADPSEPTMIVVDGYYSDGCDASFEPLVTSSGSVHSLRAIITKQVNEDQMCTMVLRPFAEQVSLGNLPAGEHVVQFASESGPRELRLTVD